MAGGATTADGQDTSLQPSDEADQARGRPALQHQHQLGPLSSRTEGLEVIVAPNLAGRPKVWFVIGLERNGQTTLIRYVMERLTANGGTATIASLDPQNRSLACFFDGIGQPLTNDAAAVTQWLESLLLAMMEDGMSAILDFSGGDTSLCRLLAEVTDLAATMEETSVVPVAMYLLSPRVDDLASLVTFEARGFQPRATALVLNEGLIDPTVAREDAFARVIQHNAFKAAVARGATVLWMPGLEPRVAGEIERRGFQFAAARDGVTLNSRSKTPLNVFDRSRVRTWMNGMDAMLHPINVWLPH